MEERRKYKRVPVDAIMMYQVKNYPDEKEAEFHKIGTPISVDISKGGLQIAASQQLPVTTVLHIILSIATTKAPIELTGKVAWVNNDEKDKDLYKMGIEFVDLNDEAKKKMLDEYVDLKD
ncbi:MAG: PilZ domain-containing protein [Spirochaetes bacterium]|nr:PilZ domain-containing protein [Spirochaetota bacterium]